MVNKHWGTIRHNRNNVSSSFLKMKFTIAKMYKVKFCYWTKNNGGINSS